MSGGLDDRREEAGEVVVPVPGVDWMLKRRSVCPGSMSPPGQCSSFALSPSVHRDLQQTGEEHQAEDLLVIISNALTQSAFIAMNLVVLVGVLESNFK